MRLVPASPTARTSKPVRIFSVAKDSGIDTRKYNRDFIKQVAENWNKLQSNETPGIPHPVAFQIPLADVGIGHEEEQEIAAKFSDRTDLPSCGRPDKVWVEGDHLMATLKDVPVRLAADINAGHYSTVSSEFYDNYRTPDGERIGPVLRRISILGGEIPRVKNLGRLPKMVFSEYADQGQTTIYFSERYQMDREGMLQALADLGMDVSQIGPEVSDAVLKFLLDTISNAQSNAQNVSTNNDDAPPMEGTEPMIEGENPMFDDQQMQAFAERAIAKTVNPLKAEVARLKRELATAGKVVSETVATKEKQLISAFCEKNKAKIYPAELNPPAGVPSLMETLLALPDTKVVKFGEKGETISPREALMRQIEARPVVRSFSERMQHTEIAPDSAERERAKAMLASEPLKYLVQPKS